VNSTLILAFWQQRLGSPLRMAVLLLIAGAPALVALAAPPLGLAVASDTFAIAMVFAVGMIAHDVSSGVLQLVFARPVRRWEYVVSRWAAVAGAGTAVVLLQTALVSGMLALRGRGPEPGDLALFAAGRSLEIIGLAAVMALLSSMTIGYVDVVLYVVAQMASGLLQLAGQVKGWPAVLRIGEELGGVLAPKIHLAGIAAGAGSWSEVTAYLSTVTLCVLLAIIAINRRELSYASG
jgi:hypothetical protein